MGVLKMEWMDEEFKLKSKSDTQREKEVLIFLRNGDWWDVALKVLWERAPTPDQQRTRKMMESKLR